MRAGRPYLYGSKNWVTHSPSEAQGDGNCGCTPSPGSTHLAANEAALERAQHPPSAAGSEPVWLAPCLQAGYRWWALLAHTPQICLAHEAFDCARASVELMGRDVCPRAGGRAGMSLLVSGRSSRKPLMVQTSLLLTGPHLLGCHLDCAPGVLNKKALPAPSRKKVSVKKLQSTKGWELIRKVPSPAGSWREPQENSPGNMCGHRALFSLFCAHSSLGPPLPGHTACMLEGKEQMLLEMSTSAGLGEVSLQHQPQDLLSLPCWLKGRAGAFGEERGTADTGVPAGARSPAWAPRAEERRGSAPERVGSSCLPLPLRSGEGRLPRQLLSQPWGAVGRDTLLSPCSLEPRSGCFIANMVHIDGEYLESLCPTSAGFPLPDAPVPTLKEQ